MDDKYKYSYVAICDCGVVVAATIDNPDHRRDVAANVASFVRDGYVVQRIQTDQVGELFKSCQCETKGQIPLFEDRTDAD